MGLIELFLTAVGLSMDAFAVAACAGLSMKRATFKKALVYGLYFGVFQAGMPVLGYFLGAQFADRISAFDHWLAFALLAFIGIRMIIGSFKKHDGEDASPAEDESLSPARLLPLALATSIDALAVGISFAFMNVQIIPAAVIIGVVTLLLSMLGVKIGNAFGVRFKSKAEFAGGLILVLIGVRILLEHFGG